jgi:hypothetical protein
VKDDFRTQLTAVIDDLLSWAMHLIGAEHISQDCGADTFGRTGRSSFL